MDSANLINRISAQPSISETEVELVKRNTDHLKIMLSKTFWTTEDLSPLVSAAMVTVIAK